MASCVNESDIQKLSSQLNQDLSLHQDRFFAGSSSSAIYQEDQFMQNDALAREFLQPHQPPADFQSLNFKNELSHPLHSQDWASEFQQGNLPHHEFEEAYQNATAAPYVGWENEFMQFQHQNHPLNPETEEAFQKAFEEAQKTTNWVNDFKAESSDNWASEFQLANENISAVDEKDALVKTAGKLSEILEGSSNQKFKDSSFLRFMQDIRDEKLAIQGDKLVENIVPATNWASEFKNSNAEEWASEYVDGQQDWTSEFQSSRTQEEVSWSDDFQRQMKLSDDFIADDWAKEFDQFKNMDIPLDEDLFNKAWQDTPAANTFEEYKFAPHNPFMDQSLDDLKDTTKHKNLVETILALEAAVLKDPSDGETWYKLGLKQQENENEIYSIAALKQAVKLSPQLLPAWLALGVAFTNEGLYDEAYNSLENWMANSKEHRDVWLNRRDGHVDRHSSVVSMFMDAVRSKRTVDPDVQSALGVLFNISGDYDKAIDCFQAAVSAKPQDYLLWNRLGATLANSNRTEQAVDAYYNALSLNPSYIRAIYNMAVSCIQLDQYQEAAEHLLSAISIQQSHTNSVQGEMRMNLSSDALWTTLRLVLFNHLQRADLIRAVEDRNLEAFKEEFDFE